MAIVCFSVTQNRSFDRVQTYVDQFNRVKDCNAPFVLVATKIDQRPTERCQVTNEEGKALAKKLGALAYLECSAMTFQGVDGVFDECLRLYIDIVLPKRRANDDKKKDCVVC